MEKVSIEMYGAVVFPVVLCGSVAWSLALGGGAWTGCFWEQSVGEDGGPRGRTCFGGVCIVVAFTACVFHLILLG
jgi:hypothetical protein